MNGMRRIGWAVASMVALVGCRSVLLDCNFGRDPRPAGWRTGVYGRPGAASDGDWTAAPDDSRRRCVTVRTGMWESPALSVEPFAYYRVSFAYRTSAPAFRVVRFFDAEGRELVADDHNALDAAAGWTADEFFTQAREGAGTIRVGFCAGDSELAVDDVRVAPATSREVLAAADRLYAGLPPVECTPDPSRWEHLSRTRALLRGGQPLRVLLLGDSIANDIGNSLFHLQIERMYPGCRITLLRSIGPGKGCRFYRDRVQEYVVDKAPDLVIVAGISHDYDAAAMREVADRTRQAMQKPVEFLVLTGACIEPGMSYEWKNKGLDSPPAEVRQKAVEDEARFYAELQRLSDEVPWATLDLRTLWEAYLARSPHPRSWYQRDFVHANTRGKLVMGRLLAQALAPDAK